MGLQVGKVARSYLNRRRRGDDPERTITFSIRMTEGQHAKLRFIADRFGEPKTRVAQSLLNAAMEDALRILGSHDAFPDEERSGLSPEQRNDIIDVQVEKYREEIHRLFEEETS